MPLEIQEGREEERRAAGPHIACGHAPSARPSSASFKIARQACIPPVDGQGDVKRGSVQDRERARGAAIALTPGLKEWNTRYPFAIPPSGEGSLCRNVLEAMISGENACSRRIHGTRRARDMSMVEENIAIVSVTKTVAGPEERRSQPAW